MHEDLIGIKARLDLMLKTGCQNRRSASDSKRLGEIDNMRSPVGTQAIQSVSASDRPSSDIQKHRVVHSDSEQSDADLVIVLMMVGASPSAMQHLTASHSQSLVAEGQDPLFSDSGVSDENVPIDGSDAMNCPNEAASEQPSLDRNK
ncbi:hypothetical protein EDD86DRAFT_246663 [Gorgonomyces haynaldii]|nr:hypothetical protein EDD86DRAFT_246663 [Gorgonomyces haynaldii]